MLQLHVYLIIYKRYSYNIIFYFEFKKNSKVIVHLKGCNHCFCKTCLHKLLESAKGSMGIIDCPDPQCPSFVTVKEVEGFLGAEENSPKPVQIVSP